MMHRVKIGLNRKVQQPKGQTTDLVVARFKFRKWQNGYSNNNEPWIVLYPLVLLSFLTTFCK